MKINRTGKSTPSTPVAGGGRAGGKARAGKSSSQQSSTNVSLGATAQHLQTIEASMESAPVVNAAKVAEVKLAVDQGRFAVNSEVVADKLIESTGKMMNKKAGGTGE